MSVPECEREQTAGSHVCPGSTGTSGRLGDNTVGPPSKGCLLRCLSPATCGILRGERAGNAPDLPGASVWGQILQFSETTLNSIRSGHIKIGYVNTTIEDSGFGPIPIPCQGWALEILTFCLGTVSGGIAAGFLGAFGKDLYMRIKTFFSREKKAIFELRDTHRKIEHKPFCYSFVFDHDGKKIAIAYDIREDHELEYSIINGESKILGELTYAINNLSEGYNFIEIDVEIANNNQIVVGHKFRSTTDLYLWFNRFKEISEK